MCRYTDSARERHSKCLYGVEKRFNYGDTLADEQNAEIRFLAVEQESRGQRICGKYIQEGQEKGEIASHKSFRGNQHEDNLGTELSTKTLSEIGLTPYESMIFQQIASIPEEEFEEVIEDSQAKISDARISLKYIKKELYIIPLVLSLKRPLFNVCQNV